MTNYLKSEFLKQKHRFTLKILWLSPFIPIALVIILMGGGYFMEGSFNWWYTFILPGSLSMIVAFTVSAERKHNRHGLFAVIVHKKKLWLSQIFVNTILLLFLNLIFFGVMIVTGEFLGIHIPFINTLSACFVLFLTFAWQVPVFMLISEKIGSFSSIIIALICNMGFGIFFAPAKLWFVPFAIPARLMCPMIKVMPNGLPIPAGHRLGDHGVILTGIVITAVLYFVFSYITTLWFDKREVR